MKRRLGLVARRGRCHRLTSLCAHSIVARSRSSTKEAADTFAVDLPSHAQCSRVGCHAATTASRPLGRLRRALRAALTRPTRRGHWQGRAEGIAFVATTVTSTNGGR